MKNQQPISGFLTHHNEYIIMIDGGRCCEIRPDKLMFQLMGMNYFSWIFEKKNTMKFKEELIPKHFILFLPLLQKETQWRIQILYIQLLPLNMRQSEETNQLAFLYIRKLNIHHD